MSHAVLDRAPNLWNYRCSRDRVGLGSLSLCYLLANSRGLGNRSDGIPAEPGFVVDTTHGGPQSSSAELDNLRTAMGCDSSGEHRSALHVPFLPALAALSPAA